MAEASRLQTGVCDAFVLGIIDPMNRIDRETARRTDQIAIHDYGMTASLLMENAGRGCAEFIERHGFRQVLVLCGKGNNAGDGFVIARQLAIAGIPSETLIFAQPDSFKGAAAIQLEILQSLSLVHRYINDERTLDRYQQASETPPDCIVDCLLGTGGQGNPRPMFATAISWVHTQPAVRIAIDIPTGLDCNSGEPGQPTFKADHTLTMVAEKTGFTNPSAIPYLGQVHVIHIGIPPQVILKAMAEKRPETM